jgi:metal-responsive CopG/Arc/MetJ family transcriptional regulator
MSEKQSTSTVIGLRIPLRILDKLDKMAAEEKRTRHNLLMILIEKGLEAQQ